MAVLYLNHSIRLDDTMMYNGARPSVAYTDCEIITSNGTSVLAGSSMSYQLKAGEVGRASQKAVSFKGIYSDNS